MLGPEAASAKLGDARNLLLIPAIRQLVVSTEIRALVDPVLGEGCFAVRALYFHKTQQANWKIPWHQDLKVAVRARLDDAPGYRA